VFCCKSLYRSLRQGWGKRNSRQFHLWFTLLVAFKANKSRGSSWSCQLEFFFKKMTNQIQQIKNTSRLQKNDRVYGINLKRRRSVRIMLPFVSFLDDFGSFGGTRRSRKSNVIKSIIWWAVWIVISTKLELFKLLFQVIIKLSQHCIVVQDLAIVSISGTTMKYSTYEVPRDWTIIHIVKKVIKTKLLWDNNPTDSSIMPWSISLSSLLPILASPTLPKSSTNNQITD
jgi:hypothetical protein